MADCLPDPRWYFTSTADVFMADILNGLMTGLWEDGHLIALGSAGRADRDLFHAYAPCVGDDVQNTFDFRDIMVHPDWRRRGIHTQFIERYKQEALENGCHAIYCTVDPENLPSRGAFEKAGFTPLCVQPAYDGRPRMYYRLDLRRG